MITVYYLILIIQKNNFLVLGEEPTNGINNSNGAAGKRLVLTLVWEIQDFNFA